LAAVAVQRPPDAVAVVVTFEEASRPSLSVMLRTVLSAALVVPLTVTEALSLALR
jgi:hypothetical protein